MRLRLWAHQLGFRGQIAAKPRAYSTTYTALREARSRFHRPQEFDPDTTQTGARARQASKRASGASRGGGYGAGLIATPA